MDAGGKEGPGRCCGKGLQGMTERKPDDKQDAVYVAAAGDAPERPVKRAEEINTFSVPSSG